MIYLNNLSVVGVAIKLPNRNCYCVSIVNILRFDLLLFIPLFLGGTKDYAISSYRTNTTSRLLINLSIVGHNTILSKLFLDNYYKSAVFWAIIDRTCLMVKVLKCCKIITPQLLCARSYHQTSWVMVGTVCFSCFEYNYFL